VHQTLSAVPHETNSSWVSGADKSVFIFQICASGAAVQARFVCHNQADLLPGFLSGRLISSNEGTWVLFHHDSSAAPQTVQTASPVCGTKNFVSVRLYSAPQLHRTIVAILGICARNRPFSSVKLCHNQTDPPPNFGAVGHARFEIRTPSLEPFQRGRLVFTRTWLFQCWGEAPIGTPPCHPSGV
jgi:hypothetical protein